MATNENPKTIDPPKYSMGDTIWFINSNTLQHGQISGIQRMATLLEDSWEYSIAVSYIRPALNFSSPEIQHYYFSESHCFPSKEELINSL